MIVLDASAIIALIKNEPGAERTRDALKGAVISTANWAEVVTKLTDAGKPTTLTMELLLDAGTTFADVTVADAQLAGEMRQHEWARPLSLGDRLCLALAHRLDATVLTCDRAWQAVKIDGIAVELLR